MNIKTVGDIKIPAIGFGTWQIPAEQAAGLVAKSIEVGYRHIDCAHIYGNEHEIGKTFGSYKDRKDLFITSKLWSDSHESENVKPSCLQTIKDLQLEYLDLYLIHNPVRTVSGFVPLWYKKEWLVETWREMTKLQESGLCKAVGVSNFTTTKLGWVMEDGATPSCNQVELHPYLPQNKLVKFCQDNKIVVTAYSPLGSPATIINAPACTTQGNPVLLEDPIVMEIAKKHKITTAQVLLAWGINRNTAVLAKSSSSTRMLENLTAATVELTPEDISAIAKIPTKCRYLDFKLFCPAGHTAEEYWDNDYFN